MKVLIVDDEAIVRAGMRSLVPWERHGYTLVGEAADGVQALELARKYLPDIILVDIVMPNMDGLELIRQLSKELPLSKFIILSCMNEINYYKMAISLGIKEYVLKNSANSDEILQVVTRVADEIRKERVFDAVEDSAKAYVNKHVVLTEFLNMVLKKRIMDADMILKKFESYGIGISSSVLYVVTLSLCSRKAGEERYESTLDYSVVNLCQEIINSIGKGYIFINYEDRITALVSYSGARSAEEFIRDICYRIQATISQCMDMEVSIGVSLQLKGYGEICSGYIQALDALNQVFFKDPGKVYFYNTCSNDSDIKLSAKNEKENILRVFSLNASDEIRRGMENIKKLLVSSRNCRPEYARKLYLDILYHIIEIVNKENISIAGLVDSEFNPVDFIEKPSNIHELNSSVEEFLNASKGLLNNAVKGPGTQKDVISQIKKYIEDNISIRISLGGISNEVHLSSDYLCRLFKKETGGNIFSYIMEKRIEKSKQLLGIGKSVAEVAHSTGFSSESYFIKTFKSYTGITPGQFVRQEKNDMA